jgi:hypothetical protein
VSPPARTLLRHTWIPLTIAVLLIGGVLLGLPWYYKTYHGALPERGLTPVEVEWAAAYAPWRTTIRETLLRAYANRNSVDGELGRVLDEIAGCEDEFWSEVGTPPSERLDAVAQPAAAACAAADAARQAYRAADDTPSWRTSAMLAGANDSMRGAEFNLRQLMLSQRPLERGSGRDTTVSRIEPVLSDGISGEQPTEVLCWSEDEWPVVQAELEAVGLERDAQLRVDVNAYRFRVHASPRVCDPLVAFAYDDAPAATPRVATSLLAILHAAQHAVAFVQDEDEAACEALRRVPGAATRLGASDETAQALASLAGDAGRCP